MLRTYFAWALCGLSVLVAMPTTAQSLAQLEALLREHPLLQAMDLQAQASRERATAAMALPDPVLSAGINNFPLFDPSFNAFLPTNKAIGIEQTLPSRAGRSARAGTALARAEETAELRAQRYAALRGELLVLLHEKARIARQRTLANERRAKYDELTGVAESEIDAGRPALYRLAEIEGERAEVARTLIELDGLAAQIDARLIDLVGSVPSTPAPPVEPLDWSGDPRDLHAARVAAAAIGVRDGGVEEARAAWQPQWGVRLTYQQRESGANFAGDDWVSAMVTVSLPLWSRSSQAPGLRAAQAERELAHANYMAAVRSATAQYSTYRALRRAAADGAAMIEQKIVAISDEIAAQLTVYESGVGDYAPIVDGEIAILKLRAEIAAEQARLAAATARMNALLVTP